MSLTQRLTLLYSILLGGILLVFGAGVFLLVNNVLLSQVDDRLAMTADEFIGLSGATSLKQVKFGEIPANIGSDVNVQVWGLNDELQDSYGPLGKSQQALDPFYTRTVHPKFREVEQGEKILRVLSVPLK